MALVERDEMGMAVAGGKAALMKRRGDATVNPNPIAL